jgi:DNA invertase Pin-like site-specific DNA recombinase
MTSLKATLYARYSTDKQRETSIDDQLREARARADREGWKVVATYADEGVSGSTPVALRRGGKALLADALANRFDILIVEGLDRISRELGEAETMVKRLEHRGVRIIGTADGYDTEARGRKVMRIARGLVNELYLDDLREKTHRGLAGQFDRGFSAGGKSYGYVSVAAERGMHLAIDQAEAAIVREIFESWAAGDSVARIVHALNARRVPSPRGGSWAVSAVQGSAARGLGILHNELYRGRLLWNRRQWLKDPETGRRRYVERPREEWLERAAPELRIVSEELWAAARARMTRVDGAPKLQGRPPRTLFGGLLRCQACAGPMVAVNSHRYGCNTYKDRGPTACTNSATVSRDVVDRRMLTEVRTELEAPAALAELQAAVREALAEHTRASTAGEAKTRHRLAELDGEIGRLVDAVVAVGVSPALSQRLQAAEDEVRTLRAELAAVAPASVSELSGDLIATYRRMLLQLRDVLQSDDLERTRALLADMLGPVTIVHDDEGTWAEMAKPADRLLVQAMGGSLKVVAGAGYEN